MYRFPPPQVLGRITLHEENSIVLNYFVTFVELDAYFCRLVLVIFEDFTNPIRTPYFVELYLAPGNTV